MHRDAEEVFVICRDCNAYLYSVSIYETPHDNGVRLVSCDNGCK